MTEAVPPVETVPPPLEEGVRLTPAELKRRRARSIAIAIALAAFVALFYVVTIVKIGGNILAGSGKLM